MVGLEDRGGGQPGAAEGAGEEGGEGLRDDGEGVGEVVLVQTGHVLCGVCNCNHITSIEFIEWMRERISISAQR